jgi:hypothetical protein
VYEVDFELTTMPRTIFEALALATHQVGKKLLCQLVQLKARRGKNYSANPRLVTLVSELVMYGQLRLPL